MSSSSKYKTGLYSDTSFVSAYKALTIVMCFLDTFENYILKVSTTSFCKKEQKELKEITMMVKESKVMEKLGKYIKL